MSEWKLKDGITISYIKEKIEQLLEEAKQKTLEKDNDFKYVSAYSILSGYLKGLVSGAFQKTS